MRPHLLALVTAVLAGSACSSEGGPIAGPTPDRTRIAQAGMETAAVREAVVRFLEAYAEGEDDPEVLTSVVAGPQLTDWAYWLAVQNVGLRDGVSGELDLRALRVLEIGQDAAAAALDATVTITVPTDEGAVARIPRSFESPMILTRSDTDPLSWRVVDAIRDGRSMQDSITLFDETRAVGAGGGVEVQVVSIYRFSSGTVVNVRVRNGTEEPLVVDGPHSMLQVEGRLIGSSGVTPTLQVAIEPGERTIGALDFPPIPLTSTPELTMVHFEGEGSPVVEVALPPEAYVLDLV